MQEKKTLVLLKERRLASWINYTLSPFSSEFLFGLVLFARPKSYLHSKFSGGERSGRHFLKVIRSTPAWTIRGSSRKCFISKAQDAGRYQDLLYCLARSLVIQNLVKHKIDTLTILLRTIFRIQTLYNLITIKREGPKFCEHFPYNLAPLYS